MTPEQWLGVGVFLVTMFVSFFVGQEAGDNTARAEKERIKRSIKHIGIFLGGDNKDTPMYKVEEINDILRLK